MVSGKGLGFFLLFFLPFYCVIWETEIRFGNKWQLGTQYSSFTRSSEHRFLSSGWSIHFLISKGVLHLSYLLWWNRCWLRQRKVPTSDTILLRILFCVCFVFTRITACFSFVLLSWGRFSILPAAVIYRLADKNSTVFKPGKYWGLESQWLRFLSKVLSFSRFHTRRLH